MLLFNMRIMYFFACYNKLSFHPFFVLLCYRQSECGGKNFAIFAVSSLFYAGMEAI